VQSLTEESDRREVFRFKLFKEMHNMVKFILFIFYILGICYIKIYIIFHEYYYKKTHQENKCVLMQDQYQGILMTDSQKYN
jgi:hypothetical protein